MKIVNFAAIVGTLISVSALSAMAQTPAASPAAPVASSVAPSCVVEKISIESTVADILDNPAAKAILIKHVPEIGQSDQIEQARPMTLHALQQYAPDTFTDKLLKDLDADFATIPVCPAKASK